MKKTMFITSVIMVVVLAIALTTSSLAWFAAGGNQSVEVSQFTLVAKNNAAAAGLEISNDGSSWKTTNIDLRNTQEISSGISRDTFVPLVPVGSIAEESNLKDSDDLYNLLRSEMYTSQTVVVDGETYMQTIPQAGTAWERDFYVQNTGETATNVTISLDVAVTETGNMNQRTYNAIMHVALFDETGCVWASKDGNTPASHTGNVKLIAFESSEETATDFCQPTAAWTTSSTASSVNNQKCLISKLNVVTLSLERAADTNSDGVLDYTPHHLRLIAWFDGDNLNNQNSDTTIEIEITFTVAS